MGRPRDEFLWEQVEVEVSKDGWTCKFCKEGFKGSASRIRNHLSGQGNDISACAAVPEQIRNEALKKVTRKRGRPLRISSSSSTTSQLQDPFPSSSNDPVSFATRSSEEYVTDAFIKFLIMSNRSSSAISDVTNDPYFKEYLERAHKYGVASSLLRGDSLVIEKSMLNIKQEVHQYMLMVTESWEITGCTFLTFYLNEKKQKLLTPQKVKCVYGFYCPKGFIFVEGPDYGIDLEGFLDALRLHSPRLDIDDVDLEIRHNSVLDNDLGNYHSCECSDENEELDEVGTAAECLRGEIQRICMNVCSCSQWAQGLINKAIQIHNQLLNGWEGYAREWYRKLLLKNGKRLKSEEKIKATETSGLSVFLLIMLLEHDLKSKLLFMEFEENVGDEAVLDDSNKFWDDGRKLERVLNMILKIPDLMDTLVPTAGYIIMAIDRVEDRCFRYIEKSVEGDDATLFFQDLISQLRKSTSTLIGGCWEAAAYLNPVYFIEHVERDPGFQNKVEDALKLHLGYFNLLLSEKEKVDEELKRYRDVFCNPGYPELERYHPVTLWEKYGHDLPTLRKLAIRFLSRPVTCMCNQVKKHMYELQGADDFILRLNVRMMEEFKSLGDDIYKPINLYSIH